MVRFNVTALLTFLMVISGPVERKNIATTTHPLSIQMKEAWVDSVFNQMTDDQRLGQLFMVRANSQVEDQARHKLVEQLIQDYHVGGVCFFKGSPGKQLERTNYYQDLSQIPLFVAIDAEWGLNMRLDQTVEYPHNIALGAIRQNSLIYEMGKELAHQFKRIGVNINFSPVADVNNNPNNPVINDRSFGEDKFNVSAKSYMMMLGMQDHQVMACAKHFPGHGDTDVDSHKDLPIILHDKQRLDSVELHPFKVLIEQKVGSIMVAHLDIPAYDDRGNRPTTLSENVVTKLLQDELNYEGLVFTDGLEMKGVTKYFDPGEVEAEAILAGNDILLLPENTEAAFKTIKAYIADGRLTWERIYASTKKILEAKYDLGLHHFAPRPKGDLNEELNRPAAINLKRKLIEHSLTLAGSPNDLIPVKGINKKNIAVLSIGSKSKTPFQETIQKYGTIKAYNTAMEVSSDRHNSLVELCKSKDLVIIGLHDMSRYASRDFGLTDSALKLISAIEAHTKVIITVFGNPYSLKFFTEGQDILMAYDDDSDVQDLAAQAIFGVNNITGKLPVTASDDFKFGQGVPIRNIQRLGFSIPEKVGMDSEILAGIDSIIDEMRRLRAAPGAEVLIARKGKIVYQKSYGHHTYSNNRPLQNGDLFDVASITKVASTTLALMKLYDDGKLNVNHEIGYYLPELQNTNKEDLLVEDILAHRAGLRPYIPFYRSTLVKKSRKRSRKYPSSKIYKKKKAGDYTIPVANKLYMKESYVDTIWRKIIESDLRTTPGYRYSDLGFYLMNRVVEQVTKMPVDQYVAGEFYHPLELSSTLYNPLKKFPKSQIVPTERDNYFRHQKLQGHVHDMGAAMMGGVAGHAGLFTTGQDLAVIFQMLLNDGYYGGEQILSENTVARFTNRAPGETRRGLGFDLKELAPNHPKRKENMSPLASQSTFGHLGFTGTAVWADPEEELIFIFLSNRTYPTMHNGKLNKYDIRPRIQTLVYESLMN